MTLPNVYTKKVYLCVRVWNLGRSIRSLSRTSDDSHHLTPVLGRDLHREQISVSGSNQDRHRRGFQLVSSTSFGGSFVVSSCELLAPTKFWKKTSEARPSYRPGWQADGDEAATAEKRLRRRKLELPQFGKARPQATMRLPAIATTTRQDQRSRCPTTINDSTTLLVPVLLLFKTAALAKLLLLSFYAVLQFSLSFSHIIKWQIEN